MLHVRRFWLNGIVLALIAALVLPLAVVSAQSGEEVEPIVLPAVDPLSVTGDMAIAGSSTVEPVTVAMAARFNEDGFSGNIAIAETGTSAGFERFCAEGSTDISNASRAIKDSEVADCEAIGRDVLEFLIGIDALTVAVNRDSFVDQLTRSQLVAIFTGEVTTWDQVNPEWPAETIQLFTPGVDSGTFDFFGEAVLGTKGAYEERSARFDALLTPNPTTSENDYVLVEGIQGSANAIGYFGFAYYVENQDKLKAVPIVNEKGQAVAPSMEAVEKGTYSPLARPIFIYVSAESLQRPEVRSFVEYYLTNAGKLAREVKYVPLPANAYKVALEHLQKGKKGTVFGGIAEVGVTIDELLQREGRL